MNTRTSLALLILLAALPASAQEAPAAPPEAPAAEPFRPPEGSVIIDLPSAEVNGPNVLQLLITHRFSVPVAGSNIHSLFSFDSGADINIGLSYVPVKNLEVALLRSRSLEDYEFSAKYRFLSSPESPVGLAVRVGGDARTQSTPSLCESPTRPAACGYVDHKYSFFAQAVGSVTLFSRVRLTVVPTYVSWSVQQPFVVTNSVHPDIFNVPVAASIAVTHSINIQGEVVPRIARAVSGGVGWIVAIEKTVLRHRFSFTCGNIRQSSVDQYIGPDFLGRPRDYFFGFNIVRQWKLK
jgi:Membrane bound beta barrel domain (DUF5777)